MKNGNRMKGKRKKDVRVIFQIFFREERKTQRVLKHWWLHLRKNTFPNLWRMEREGRKGVWVTLLPSLPLFPDHFLLEWTGGNSPHLPTSSLFFLSHFLPWTGAEILRELWYHSSFSFFLLSPFFLPLFCPWLSISQNREIVHERTSSLSRPSCSSAQNQPAPNNIIQLLQQLHWWAKREREEEERERQKV